MNKFLAFILVIAFSCYQCYSTNENSANDEGFVTITGKNKPITKKKTLSLPQKNETGDFEDKFLDTFINETKTIFSSRVYTQGEIKTFSEQILTWINDNADTNACIKHITNQGHCGFTKNSFDINDESKPFFMNEDIDSQQIITNKRIASPYPRSYFSNKIKGNNKTLYEDYIEALKSDKIAAEQFADQKKLASKVIREILINKKAIITKVSLRRDNGDVEIKASLTEEALFTGYSLSKDNKTYQNTKTILIVISAHENKLIIKSIYPY